MQTVMFIAPTCKKGFGAAAALPCQTVSLGDASSLRLLEDPELVDR